jgi:hypothetical protein
VTSSSLIDNILIWHFQWRHVRWKAEKLAYALVEGKRFGALDGEWSFAVSLPRRALFESRGG